MQDMKFDGDMLDEIVDLILETVCTRRKTIHIARVGYTLKALGFSLDEIKMIIHGKTAKQPLLETLEKNGRHGRKQCIPRNIKKNVRAT